MSKDIKLPIKICIMILNLQKDIKQTSLIGNVFW